MVYEDVFRLTKAFFGNIDCGLCNNYGDEDRIVCGYCSNQDQHNLLWNVNDTHAHNFTKEIIKVLRENGYDI